jgi:hypothetical protein
MRSTQLPGGASGTVGAVAFGGRDAAVMALKLDRAEHSAKVEYA